MPVNIRGKNYITVAERVAEYHKQNAKGIFVETAIVEHTTDSKGFERFIVKATVKTAKGIFTGYAEQTRGAGMISGTSPLEVGETSAIGRALGFAGYGVIESIASADEVIAKSEIKKMADELGEADKRHAK